VRRRREAALVFGLSENPLVGGVSGRVQLQFLGAEAVEVLVAERERCGRRVVVDERNDLLLGFVRRGEPLRERPEGVPVAEHTRRRVRLTEFVAELAELLAFAANAQRTEFAAAVELDDGAIVPASALTDDAVHGGSPELRPAVTTILLGEPYNE
jgi:hypothetical protein